MHDIANTNGINLENRILMSWEIMFCMSVIGKFFLQMDIKMSFRILPDYNLCKVMCIQKKWFS